MTSRLTLLALASKCNTLPAEGSTDLNLAIGAALGKLVDRSIDRTPQWEGDDYTTCITGAMRLVGDRHFILRNGDARHPPHHYGSKPSAMVFSRDWSRHDASGASPAIALCNAGLIALAEELKDHDE